MQYDDMLIKDIIILVQVEWQVHEGCLTCQICQTI